MLEPDIEHLKAESGPNCPLENYHVNRTRTTRGTGFCDSEDVAATKSGKKTIGLRNGISLQNPNQRVPFINPFTPPQSTYKILITGFLTHAY